MPFLTALSFTWLVWNELTECVHTVMLPLTKGQNNIWSTQLNTSISL